MFGFEIMPAPFVVAHLQVGLTMQALDAAFSEDGDERAGVFLTNALTGWEPRKRRRDPSSSSCSCPSYRRNVTAPSGVKQDTPKVLVVIGNPPYNGFAGDGGGRGGESER